MKEKRILKKLINILLDLFIVIFGIILMISIYNFFQTKVLKNEHSSLFGYSMFEVKTPSMSDTINVGDWIVVKYSNKIKLNDIITYKKDDVLITHRVIEEYSDTYVTKGDANNSKDDPISKEQVVGKVVKILPSFGIFKKTIFNPWVLLAIVGTLYFANYMFKSMKNDSKKIKDNDFFSDENLEPKKKNVIEVIEERTIESETKNNIANDSEECDILDEEYDDLDDEDFELEESNSFNNDYDLEQTKFFRIVSVNKDDVDCAYDKKNTRKSDIIIEDSNISEEEIETKTEAEVKKCVTELQSRKKRFKNIIDKIMYIKEDEINCIINVLNRKEKFKNNESTINEALLKSYVYARYYGIYNEEIMDINSKTTISKINDAIKNKGNDLISEYKGSDKLFEEKVNKYIKFYMLINGLEVLNSMYQDIPSKRENYKNKILPVLKNDLTSGLELMDMVNKIIVIQKVHSKIISNSLEKLNSNTFELNIENIDKNMFGVKLKHNISFSKVYSDYIVDKTYSEGTIAEDKIMILITMIISMIIESMLQSNFKNRYLIHIPASVYEKKNKLDRIFDSFNDDRARESIIVVCDYDELVKNKKVIKELRKEGFKFAVAISKDTSIKSKDSTCMSMCEYVIAKNDVVESTNLLDYIPEELKDKIINDDAYLKIID